LDLGAITQRDLTLVSPSFRVADSARTMMSYL